MGQCLQASKLRLEHGNGFHDGMYAALLGPAADARTYSTKRVGLALKQLDGRTIQRSPRWGQNARRTHARMADSTLRSHHELVGTHALNDVVTRCLCWWLCVYTTRLAVIWRQVRSTQPPTVCLLCVDRET